MKAFITNNKYKSYKIIAFIFWICVWEMVALYIDREIYLPSPMRTFNALVQLLGEREFWSVVITTILRVVLGFVISCLLGIITGVLCGFYRFLYEMIHPFIVAVKSTPVMSFIIIALIWFESDYVPVFICFLMCYPIIWTAVVEGMKQVDVKLLQMAQLFEVPKSLQIRNIYIPSIKSHLTAGMTTALGLGWKVTVAAEVLSNPRLAIGANLYNAKVYLESEVLFAWTIVVIILSMSFEYVFQHVIKRFCKRWDIV